MKNDKKKLPVRIWIWATLLVICTIGAIVCIIREKNPAFDPSGDYYQQVVEAQSGGDTASVDTDFPLTAVNDSFHGVTYHLHVERQQNQNYLLRMRVIVDMLSEKQDFSTETYEFYASETILKNHVQIVMDASNSVSFCFYDGGVFLINHGTVSSGMLLLKGNEPVISGERIFLFILPILICVAFVLISAELLVYGRKQLLPKLLAPALAAYGLILLPILFLGTEKNAYEPGMYYATTETMKNWQILSVNENSIDRETLLYDEILLLSYKGNDKKVVLINTGDVIGEFEYAVFSATKKGRKYELSLDFSNNNMASTYLEQLTSITMKEKQGNLYLVYEGSSIPIQRTGISEICFEQKIVLFDTTIPRYVVFGLMLIALVVAALPVSILQNKIRTHAEIMTMLLRDYVILPMVYCNPRFSDLKEYVEGIRLNQVLQLEETYLTFAEERVDSVSYHLIPKNVAKTLMKSIAPEMKGRRPRIRRHYEVFRDVEERRVKETYQQLWDNAERKKGLLDTHSEPLDFQIFLSKDKAYIGFFMEKELMYLFQMKSMEVAADE